MPATKHLGIYREVTEPEAALDCRILRILYRRGSLNKSVLISRLNLSATADDLTPFEDSLNRLQEWKCIDISQPHHGVARKVMLTPIGADHALDLVCEIQRFNASGTLTKPIVYRNPEE